MQIQHYHLGMEGHLKSTHTVPLNRRSQTSLFQNHFNVLMGLWNVMTTILLKIIAIQNQVYTGSLI